MSKTGTLSIGDLLDTKWAETTPSEFGYDEFYAITEREFAAHNALLRDAFGFIAEPTTERMGVVGENTDAEMQRTDEFSRVPTQKVEGGQPLHYPLFMFAFATGWTQRYFDMVSVQELARQVSKGKFGHVRMLRRELALAIYVSTNFSVRDTLVDRAVLDVKRLANADGFPIENGPFGETFDPGTHTHYLASASLTDAAAESLVSTVVEHGHDESVMIVINKADEAAWKSLTGFKEYVDTRLLNSEAARDPRKQVNTLPTNNRAIGLFNGAEVWIKPWAVANYHLAFDARGPKPLKFRQNRIPKLQGLRLASTNGVHPLFAQQIEAEFGFGAHNRTNGAVLYTGGGAYVNPSIN